MSAPSSIVSQRCSCKRGKEHLHYSSRHGVFVEYGLVLPVFTEALSFIQRFVKGSTTIFLTYISYMRQESRQNVRTVRWNGWVALG